MERNVHYRDFVDFSERDNRAADEESSGEVQQKAVAESSSEESANEKRIAHRVLSLLYCAYLSASLDSGGP